MNSLNSLNGIDLVSPESFRHMFVWMMTQPPTNEERTLFGAEAAQQVYRVRTLLARCHAKNTHDWTELLAVNTAQEARLLLGHLLDFLSTLASEEGSDPIDTETWRKYFKVLLPFLVPGQEAELNRFHEFFRSEEWIAADIWATFLAIAPDSHFPAMAKAVKVQQQLGLLLRKLVWSASAVSGPHDHYDAIRALVRPILRGMAAGRGKCLDEGVRLAQVLASLAYSWGDRVRHDDGPWDPNPHPSFWSRLRFYAARRSDLSWEATDYVGFLAGALGRIPFHQFPFLHRDVAKELILYDLVSADDQISEARSVRDAEDRIDAWFPKAPTGGQEGE